MILHRVPRRRLARWLQNGLAVGVSLHLGTWSLRASDEPALADPPPAPAAVAPAPATIVTVIPTYMLSDCLRVGREHQPSIQAAIASLRSAQMAQKGLNEIRFGSRLSKELPVRRQQSSFGVAAASANLCQVQRDVDCSIARMYYSVIYAREQKKVAEAISARLNAVVAVGETLIGKEGAPADLNALSIGKGKLYAQSASSRVDEANRGLQRATAALREAMGVGPECPFAVAEDKLPPVISGVNKDQIVQMAVSMRGEVSMASSAATIGHLEIQAQEANRRTKRPTAASGGDMHSRPVPTGSFGDDYKPGAIGLDFPTLFVGPKETRVARANEVAARGDAAAQKARGLVALEAEDAYFRWEESVEKIGKFTKAAQDAEALSKRATSALDSGIIQSYRDVLEILVIGAQIHANLNEALYNHAVSLTELERVTAGGFPTVTVNVP